MAFRLSLMDMVGIAGMVGIVGSGISINLVFRARNRVRKEPYF